MGLTETVEAEPLDSATRDLLFLTCLRLHNADVREVLIDRVLLGRTISEIARDMGVSRNWATRLDGKARGLLAYLKEGT